MIARGRVTALQQDTALVRRPGTTVSLSTRGKETTRGREPLTRRTTAGTAPQFLQVKKTLKGVAVATELVDASSLAKQRAPTRQDNQSSWGGGGRHP